MNKPLGVTASAIIALLGSLLTLGCLVLVAVSFFLSAQTRAVAPEARFGIVVGLAMFAILGTWGTTTAIGLFRLSNWARISMLVFAAFLVLMGAMAAPMILLMPLPPTATPNVGTVRVAVAGFYGVLGLLGVFWCYYFARRSTRQVFVGASDEGMQGESGGRPLSISILGWWFLVCGIVAILGSPLRMPAVAFIWIITGWTAAVWQFAFGALWTYVAYGLLRLDPMSRKIAVALLSFGASNAIVFLVVPGRSVRLAALMSHSPFVTQSALPPHFFDLMTIPMLLGLALPLWFLVTRKGAFDASRLNSLPDAR